MSHVSGAGPRTARWQVRFVAAVLSASLCLLLGELGARAFWFLRFEVPFPEPGRILYAYYPELRLVDERHPARGDRYYDILLPGGSVLHRDWSAVEQALAERVAGDGVRRGRISNLAMPAQPSREQLAQIRRPGWGPL